MLSPQGIPTEHLIYCFSSLTRGTSTDEKKRKENKRQEKTLRTKQLSPSI